MAASASTSSSSAPCSETEGSLHPYQQTTTGCINPKSPQGAYEARKVKPGLYIRVDMPGVPDDAIKITKYNETRTVTFSGKATPVWTGFDSPGTRTYGGFVVIDRDIDDVDFVTELKNGCFRMFFSQCDGSLNFLSLPSCSPPSQNDNTGEDDEEEIVIDFPIVTTTVAHDSRHPSGMRLVGGCPDHINPYLLSGAKGVYEHKMVTLVNGDHLIYVRVDLPDTSMDSTALAEDFKNGILFMTEVEKNDYYSRFDEETRGYHGLLAPACDCCKLRIVKYENVNGVLRFLARKISVDENNVVPNQVRLITQ